MPSRAESERLRALLDIAVAQKIIDHKNDRNPRASRPRSTALTLRAFPRDQRAAYAAEMADAFGRELPQARAGTVEGLRFVVAAWVDGVRAGMGERRYQRQRRRDVRRGEAMNLGMSWLDVKLGFRMLRQVSRA